MLSKDDFRIVAYNSLKKVLETDEVTIGDDEIFMDYGVDSLDRMNLQLELENELNQELGEIDLEEINTINTLYDHIFKK